MVWVCVCLVWVWLAYVCVWYGYVCVWYGYGWHMYVFGMGMCVSGMGMVWVCVCVWYGYGRNVCVSGMGMVWGMCVFGYTHLIIYDFWMDTPILTIFGDVLLRWFRVPHGWVAGSLSQLDAIWTSMTIVAMGLWNTILETVRWYQPDVLHNWSEAPLACRIPLFMKCIVRNQSNFNLLRFYHMAVTKQFFGPISEYFWSTVFKSHSKSK